MGLPVIPAVPSGRVAMLRSCACWRSRSACSAAAVFFRSCSSARPMADWTFAILSEIPLQS